MPPRFEADDDDVLRIVPVADERAQSLGNLSAVIIDGDRAFVDPGALHGRSAVEQGVRWAADPGEVPNAQPYWVAWVTLGRNENGERGYRGLTVSPMWIDPQAKVGYKRLADHVNAMKAALDGQVELGELPDTARTALAAELKGRGLRFWHNATAAFKQAFGAR
ncbi:MAG TPA: YwhD family protein [Bacillota bacterium]